MVYDEIYYSTPPMPAVNGEPYYPAFLMMIRRPTAKADLNCRSGMYGGFLSGGFGGYIYGAEGLWGADIEPDAKYRMWDAMQFESGKMVRYTGRFCIRQRKQISGFGT